MRSGLPTMLVQGGVVLGIWSGLAMGEEPPAPPPGYGACPLCVAPWARPGRTPADIGYYVGGGLPIRGEPNLAHEGTWGWDYQGWCLHRHVWLWWSHGQRSQGGTGAYQTDGPDLHSLHYLGHPEE